MQASPRRLGRRVSAGNIGHDRFAPPWREAKPPGRDSGARLPRSRANGVGLPAPPGGKARRAAGPARCRRRRRPTGRWSGTSRVTPTRVLSTTDELIPGPCGGAAPLRETPFLTGSEPLSSRRAQLVPRRPCCGRSPSVTARETQVALSCDRPSEPKPMRARAAARRSRDPSQMENWTASFQSVSRKGPTETASRAAASRAA